MLRVLYRHWPEYLMEGAGVGVLVIAACTFAMLWFHPESPIAEVVQDVVARRFLMGVAMGSTAIFLVFSAWGKQSGAHFNPAVTLTYFRLQRVPGPDAAWYALSQLSGALLAVGMMVLLFRPWLSHPEIHYLSAMPGPYGACLTWATEFVASVLLMTIVLMASNSRRFARWTGIFAGLLTVANVSVLVPLVGTSLNPARSLASAVPAHVWTSIWIYLTAAPAGMLAAAAFYIRRHGPGSVFCAKLHHQNNRRCIFCESRAAQAELRETTAACNQLPVEASKRQTSST
jgi:aquaporin Z